METARYFTTLDSKPVQLFNVQWVCGESTAEPSESLLRVVSNGKYAVGTVDGSSLHEADRCIAYSDTPSLHKCDARCGNAKGNQCECSCGGLNHGKGQVASHAFDWSSLEDDSEFSGIRKAPADVAKIDVASQLGMGRAQSIATLARFRCDNCGGTGRWRPVPWSIKSWDCRRCHGKGLLKTDPAVLKANRDAAAQKKLDARKQYREGHADVFAWLEKQTNNNFASSLLASFVKWGTLTEGQIGAVRKGIARDVERIANPRRADAVVIGEGFDRIIQAFAAAKRSGLKYPKFQVGAYVFTPATANSKHPGCIFVKGGRGFNSTYYGKIDSAGKLFTSRDCTDTHKAAIEEVCKDPLAAAVMHGKQTGRCSCCGRELENEESVQLGIGPICRRNWGLK